MNRVLIMSICTGVAALGGACSKRVQVIGDATPGQKAETREVTPAAPAATSGSASDKGQVSTVEDTKVDADALRVTSVMPVLGDCSHP